MVASNTKFAGNFQGLGSSTRRGGDRRNAHLTVDFPAQDP